MCKKNRNVTKKDGRKITSLLVFNHNENHNIHLCICLFDKVQKQKHRILMLKVYKLMFFALMGF